MTSVKAHIRLQAVFGSGDNVEAKSRGAKKRNSQPLLRVEIPSLVASYPGGSTELLAQPGEFRWNYKKLLNARFSSFFRFTILRSRIAYDGFLSVSVATANKYRKRHHYQRTGR